MKVQLQDYHDEQNNGFPKPKQHHHKLKNVPLLVLQLEILFY